jgi:hypothetical protein
LRRRLERRVHGLEDHIAILNLLARYGPSVDAGASAAAAARELDGSEATRTVLARAVV